MTATPSHPGTLIDLLELRATANPKSVALTFGGRDYTFGDLDRDSQLVAALLFQRHVSAGDRVVIVLPNGLEFFAAYYGALRAGAVPVPLYPRSGADRILDLAHACGAALVLYGQDLPAETLDRLERGGEETDRLLCLTRERLGGESRDGSPRTGVEPRQPALIQYTSGSTGDPKGVVLTHEDLLTNCRQMIAGMEIVPEDVFVSWLPVHHDMGLILMTMVPFVVGARLVLLPSSLTDVRRWLDAIATHRGTFTAAPDFAYRLCLRTVRDPSRYDLRSLRVALDAAEPVRATTLRRFEEAFGLPHTLVAGYGLAEATVGVSMQPPGTPPVLSPRGLVSIGRPFPGVRLHVVDDEGRPSADGSVGELVVESPANTSGYYRNRRATEELFWRPGAIRTGDLAFRDGAGEVFLVGRKKNIIIQSGRNVAPQELEETAEALSFVRQAAAVGIDRGGEEGEQAYLFVELRRAKPPATERMQEMSVELVARLHERIGLRPARVLLLRPRSIPRTANGKVRHAALRTSYLDGELRGQGRILFPDW